MRLSGSARAAWHGCIRAGTASHRGPVLPDPAGPFVQPPALPEAGTLSEKACGERVCNRSRGTERPHNAPSFSLAGPLQHTTTSVLCCSPFCPHRPSTCEPTSSRASPSSCGWPARRRRSCSWWVAGWGGVQPAGAWLPWHMCMAKRMPGQPAVIHPAPSPHFPPTGLPLPQPQNDSMAISERDLEQLLVRGANSPLFGPCLWRCCCRAMPALLVLPPSSGCPASPSRPSPAIARRRLTICAS